MHTTKQLRTWMKSDFSSFEDNPTDQQLNLPQPPLTKSFSEEAEAINLPEVKNDILKSNDFLQIINNRVSHRKFLNHPITLDELSFLLWSTQGVKTVKGDNYATIRTVPSAGARHPFETYLAVQNVIGLEPGVYLYLALTHQLVYIKAFQDYEYELSTLSLGQKFVGKSAVTFFWSVLPYRGEWRYSLRSHKAMLLDAGHVCQNLYLAVEAIGCGTCAIAAYDQKLADSFLDLDGEDEFIIYLAPVGKV